MRVLIVHNHYGDFVVGGEAMVMKAEADLLKQNGHDVYIYERANIEIARQSVIGKIKTLMNVAWSSESYNLISRIIDDYQPDIMHVHNYKFLLSPSIFKAAKDKGVKTVFTLHNYRLVCPADQFLHHKTGKVCEACLDGFPLRVLWRRCAPKNIIQQLAELHLYIETKKRSFLNEWVDAYICLSEFAKKKFVQVGIPSHKIHVKPNFMTDMPYNHVEDSEKVGAVFVGRLSTEKGLNLLIKAWQEIDYPLTIIGDGPLLANLKKMASSNIKFIGGKEHAEVIKILRLSDFLVFPSIWYEGFPMVLVEAMALGKPVVASNLGPRSEVVIHGETGLLYEASNVNDLREKVNFLIARPDLHKKMGEMARQIFKQCYTDQLNYKRLIDIYLN